MDPKYRSDPKYRMDRMDPKFCMDRMDPKYRMDRMDPKYRMDPPADQATAPVTPGHGGQLPYILPVLTVFYRQNIGSMPTLACNARAWRAARS